MREPNPTIEPEPDVMPDVEPISEPEAEWESEGGAVLPPGMPLTLHGPDGAGPDELDAALQAARDALPRGYRLERD